MARFCSFIAKLVLAVTFVGDSIAESPSRHTNVKPPSVHTRNGTYVGRYLPEYKQDLFLGLPYAQPPTGSLRFRVPQSLNTAFSGERYATEYSDECVGYGSDQFGYSTSEDCLYLNIVRPTRNQASGDGSLPVAVWIHGGGFYQGGSADRRYNLSFIVQNGVEIGKPFIGVSINYRLSAWGLLASNEVAGTGNLNIALRDQRLAFHWIQENIAAFGGDPAKVTIWGESAGAASVGFHLTAYGGRDDKLFQGAVMESGNPIAYKAMNGTDYFEPLYQAVVANASCADAISSLDCLRGLPFDTLNAVLNNSFAQAWYPIVDGDLIQRWGSVELQQGAFVKVPVLDGTNSDEGTAFAVQGINTTQQFAAYVQNSSFVNAQPGIQLPSSAVSKILEAYPDDPCDGVPLELGCSRASPGYGRQWRRAAAYAGDVVFIAARRATAEAWAAHDIPFYSYRFNTLAAGVPADIGVTHFTEVAFVFDNTDGYGYYKPISFDPFKGKPQSYSTLAKLMSNSWVSFFVDQNPNSYRNTSLGRMSVKSAQGQIVPYWEQYTQSKKQNFVLDANVTSHVEPDSFRQKGISLINSLRLAYHN